MIVRQIIDVAGNMTESKETLTSTCISYHPPREMPHIRDVFVETILGDSCVGPLARWGGDVFDWISLLSDQIVA